MEKLILVKTLSDLKSLREYLVDKEYVSFDTETTGVDKESKIIGLSVSADVDVGYYVVLSHFDHLTNDMISLTTELEVKDLLIQLKAKKLIMHNAIFDCMMVENNYNISFIDSVHTDTMLLGHLLDENRSNGLKELGTALYGDDVRKEQAEMKASVEANGGSLTKVAFELYKADCDLIGKYGAKDAILTLRLFYEFIPKLIEENLYDFFYNETMPLLKGPTYDLNSTGLKVDATKLEKLKGELEAECMMAQDFIHKEIETYVKEKYPAKNAKTTFNITSKKQLAWLLFYELDNEFGLLTDGGKELCHKLGMKIPYSQFAKREFIKFCRENKGQIYEKECVNLKTKKTTRPKKIGDPWIYLACDKTVLTKLSKKYKWVEKLLEFNKNSKLLSTYVEGIKSRMKYNVIRPSFIQIGTTSGRYSSRNPNFQNLPRDDKRVKACIVSRPGKVFVGADYSQLEPRVFASFSKDKRLLDCFKNGDDFYSVIGMEVFEKFNMSLKKSDENSFAKKYPKLRDISKVIALSATYGTTAPKMAPAIGKSIDECQEIIDSYFKKFPNVKTFMLESHRQAIDNGIVFNYFGRPRRMPKAMDIPKIYGNQPHEKLPYEARNMLNLAINHIIQSTAASIMNRAAIKFTNEIKELTRENPMWGEVRLVMQIHDQIIAEGPSELGEEIKKIMKDSMENTVKLEGVDLIADPSISTDLAGQK